MYVQLWGLIMTVKIITRGIDPKTIPWRGTCFNCKTVIECGKEDTTHHPNYDPRDPREQAYETASCPVCNSQVIVNPYNIPVIPMPTSFVRGSR